MADSDDDILMDLLTYSCPFTGKRRVAGLTGFDEFQPDKRQKFLASWVSRYLPIKPFKVNIPTLTHKVQPQSKVCSGPQNPWRGFGLHGLLCQGPAGRWHAAGLQSSALCAEGGFAGGTLGQRSAMVGVSRKYVQPLLQNFKCWTFLDTKPCI